MDGHVNETTLGSAHEEGIAKVDISEPVFGCHLQETLERDLCFQPGEWGPNAEVRSPPERKV
jgi:hypothetical protein